MTRTCPQFTTSTAGSESHKGELIVTWIEASKKPLRTFLFLLCDLRLKAKDNVADINRPLPNSSFSLILYLTLGTGFVLEDFHNNFGGHF